MADSNITRNAMAAAMKALMKEKKLSKISISDICGACGMNRNSFYYHFKDKYDRSPQQAAAIPIATAYTLE